MLFGLVGNLVRGRIGRAMRAVRDNALAAEATGIDVALFKTRTFAVSAMITGIAGSLSAIVVGFVSPDSFTVFLSITLFTGLVVGGAATVAGPVFGAIFITFLPNVAEQISKAAPGVIYGVVLIAFMFLLPGRRRRRSGPAPTSTIIMEEATNVPPHSTHHRWRRAGHACACSAAPGPPTRRA